MTVERYGATVDLNLVVPFDDHAIAMTRFRAGAAVANTGDSPSHNDRGVPTRHDLTAMAGRISDTNHTAQTILLIIATPGVVSHVICYPIRHACRTSLKNQVTAALSTALHTIAVSAMPSVNLRRDHLDIAKTIAT